MRGSVFHALNRFGERSETFIADAISDLDALGWKAWVASAHPPVNRDEFPFPPEERFLAPCRPPAIRRAAARLKTREARLRWAEWWRPVMEALEPDVIQIHFGWTAAAFALERFDIPIVVTFHGSDVRSWPHEEVANQRVYEELFGYLRYATAGSQSLAQDLRELGFRGRLEVVPPGVHLDSFRFRPPRDTVDTTNLLFVGRQVSCKGLDVLLTALRDVVQQRLEVRLAVIGDGPDASTEYRPQYLARVGQLRRVPRQPSARRGDASASAGRHPHRSEPDECRGRGGGKRARTEGGIRGRRSGRCDGLRRLTGDNAPKPTRWARA